MSKIDKIAKEDYIALAAFRHALRQFIHFSEDAARQIGLTPQQHQAILAIQGFPGREEVTVGELAERLQIQHNSAVGLVNRLEINGLIERHGGHGDRRSVYIALTPHARALLDKLTNAHREEVARLGTYLTAALEQIEKR
jgi:DNA-binding MarR family transcriptional regulator